ncbi:hypothetical protein N7474_006365 [Penicillium riverlandense]|uniref:uncharacterized protein n=1 Tax=Penicillium riverlandense TaxID=1903569 RepID=UPI00254743BF|nr:uncharacterized protein N7474_006365 [Penicillium riverlandense]KAJ5814588.1 hypothetical protein N7474_006365 [Penicillium riverlandense]
MQCITITQTPDPPTRDFPSSADVPAELPPAKEIKLHPSASGEENASLFFVGTATTIMFVRNPPDHFDQKVEASLRRDLPIITTPHAQAHLTAKGADSFTCVSALNPFEQVFVEINGALAKRRGKHARLRVTGMPGKHVPPTNGWMLELGHGAPGTANFECGYRIYISGDTLMVDELKEIPRRYAGQQIDLMLAHLGGTMIPSPAMAPLALMVTMDAEQGLQLMQLIQPDITIPIHYDDYEVFASPLADFVRVVEEAGLQGKVVYLDRRDQYRFRQMPRHLTGLFPPLERFSTSFPFSSHPSATVMPLFSRKPKSPAQHPSPVFLSSDSLSSDAQQPPPDEPYARHPTDLDAAYEDRLAPSSPTATVDPALPSPSLQRSLSQTQPHLKDRDRPTSTVVTPDHAQSRRLKKHRSPSALLGRSVTVSVRGKRISHPISLPTSPRFPPSPSPPFDEDQYQYSMPQHGRSLEATQLYEPRSASLAYQQKHQQTYRGLRSPQPTHADQPQYQQQQEQQTESPPPLHRSSTDPTLLEQLRRPSPIKSDLELHPAHRQDRSTLSARSPSRQTPEPASPLRTQTVPDAMQQAQPQQQQTPPGPVSDERRAGTPSQDSGRRASVNPTMPTEADRRTPTNVNANSSNASRSREDISELDVRALIQKHDELQEAKYSKVKRYYFDKEAQVQHLQNTVAHQRMAVSRTVLDDNEYTNRFQRLDGAIKDLAFSVRKEWCGIPHWLHGYVTEDAVDKGTKEMTALGRAVISRWLVEEVFQRHFHPALEPNLSLQLKSLEMNLRRQGTHPQSEEDRENMAARLSNWRRTTFDGLGDSLVGPAAEAHRADLVEHLVAQLTSFLSGQLHESGLPGLEAGVRMIIENTINIAEKIPLEARDVCVEYFPPGVPIQDAYMKVEPGLPPLAHIPQAPRLSVEQEHEEHNAAGAPVEADSSSGSNSNPGAVAGDAASPVHPHRKRPSMLGALMGHRKPASGPSGRSATESDDKAESVPRIRFAGFVAVEVRNKGPLMNVLNKAPVWLLE